MSLMLRFAARSDVGLIRTNNEDAVYAGPRLVAVADGMGGHAAGDVASAVTIATLAPLDDDDPPSDLLGVLEQSIRQANDQLRQLTVCTACATDARGSKLETPSRFPRWVRR